MIRLYYRNGLFLARSDFASRHIPRSAGFRFERGVWITESLKAAVKLREYADPSAREHLDRVTIHRSPWLDGVTFPDGLEPYPHQIKAAFFALERNKAYLGLAPRLGKSIVSALVINALRTPTVFIAPPFLTRNVEAELRKWTVPWMGKPPVIVRFDTKEAQIERPDILIVPDSVIQRPSVQAEIWDVARDGLLIVDEAHRFKSAKAVRTNALFGEDGKPGLIDAFSRHLFLSGTPMPNRPLELYPILSKVAPETIDFMDLDEYGAHYCDGRWNGYEYDYSGASNLDELRRRVIGPFMLRMKTVPGLPPKVEEMVIIGERPPKLIGMESKLLAEHSPEDLMTGRVSTDHIATYRRELGRLKVEPALDFVRSLLDETEESVLVFAFHKEVVSGLVEGLRDFAPLVITGGTSKEARFEIEKEFQSNPKRRLFIGQYVASGLGITLSKADRVVMVEYSWTPAENDQASDRGNALNAGKDLFVQYLVFENSIDRKVMETNFRKRKITNYL